VIVVCPIVVANYISRDQRCRDAHREQVRIFPSLEAPRIPGDLARLELVNLHVK